MTPTAEEIEVIARPMKEAVGAEALDVVEEKAYRLMALAAWHAARPAIRREALEEAAKKCDVIENKLTEQWKAGHKICDYTQGASDGANDCAAAIRALKEKQDADKA